MNLQFRPDYDQLERLMTGTGMSWWVFNFGTRTLRGPASLFRILGVNKEVLTPEEIAQLTRQDYRTRLYAQFAAIKVEDRFDERFPIITPDGEVWLHVVLGYKSIDPETGAVLATGTMQRIHIPNQETVEHLTSESNYKAAIKELGHVNDLLHHMPIGYFRIKLLYDKNNQPIDYLFVNINREAAQIVGGKALSYIGKTARELGLPVEQQLRFMTKIPSGEHISNYWQAEATKRHCKGYTYNTPHDNSEIVVLVLDVTETAKAHETLYRNENLLRNVFLNIPVGVAIFSPEGLLMQMNAKWTEMFGVTDSSKAIGIDFFENPNISDEIKQKVREGQEVDVTITYDFAKVGSYYPTTRHDKIDCAARIRSLYTNTGERESFLVINIDNTEINRTNHQLEQFEDMFHHISSFARVGYASYNLLTKQGYAQGVWHENYGEEASASLTQIIGKYSHLHPEDRKRMQQALLQFQRGQISSLDETLRVVQQDGSITWTRTTLICRKYSPQHGVVEMIGISYDITELIRARERAEESNRLKSAFLANMSHEIRTPLNAIIGFSELVASRTGTDAEQQQYINIIRHNNALLLQIVSDILDLSKIEARTSVATSDEVNLAAVCRQIASDFAPQAPSTIRVFAVTPLPTCYIRTSRQSVLQILSNLTNNALKFTQEGEVRIGLCDHGEQIEIYVEDTGIGIEAELLPQLFERFVKANLFSQGTGLGLAICKGLAEQIGGHIDATSTPGKGSRFSLWLPKK